jgi:hypothetical protein
MQIAAHVLATNWNVCIGHNGSRPYKEKLAVVITWPRRNLRRALVEMVMNLYVPWNAVNFLTTRDVTLLPSAANLVPPLRYTVFHYPNIMLEWVWFRIRLSYEFNLASGTGQPQWGVVFLSSPWNWPQQLRSTLFPNNHSLIIATFDAIQYNLLQRNKTYNK